MQLFQLICVCALILYATGLLGEACHALGISGGTAAFVALAALLLSGFNVTPNPEISVNAAVLMLPVVQLPTLLKNRKLDIAFSASLVLCAVLVGAICFALGIENGLLLGFAAGVLGHLAAHGGVQRGLFAAALLPVMACLASAGLELLSTGYADCNLSAAYLLDAQLTGCLATGLLSLVRLKMDMGVIKQ